MIAHTAASRLLAEDPALQAWVGFNAEDTFPAGANVLKALRTHPEATSLTRTGFNFANGTVDKEPMFVTFGKDPQRAKRMGSAMASLSDGEGYEVRHFVEDYDLSDVDERKGTFVDVGGSHGFVSVDLAKKWRNMKFVVQDLQKTIDSAPKPLCEDQQVASRISLHAHDFFTEQQPVKGADGKSQLGIRRGLDPKNANIRQCTTSAGSCTTSQPLTSSPSSRASSHPSKPVLASSSTTTVSANLDPRTPGTRSSSEAWTWSC